jgi:hypothetical protein
MQAGGEHDTEENHYDGERGDPDPVATKAAPGEHPKPG